MHRTITTLHESRTLYPDSAAIPTLTQSGLLGLLLDRQRYKAANLARRRARWKSICAAPRNLFVRIWRAVTVLELPRDGIGSISPSSQIPPSPDLPPSQTTARPDSQRVQDHGTGPRCRLGGVGFLPVTAQTSAVDTNLKPLLIAMSDKIRSYAELRELVRLSLRAQHPEWVEPNGDSPICDSYEARFAELLRLTFRKETTRQTRDGQLR